MSFPRLVNFTENESMKSIGFKIYKEMRPTLKTVMLAQIQTLHGQASIHETDSIEANDEAQLKHNYECRFVERALD